MSIITLVGMMGCGKSTVGNELAHTLNKSYFDTDIIIAKNSPIQDIFINHGEKYFREIEYNIIRKLLSTEDDAIISLGGGAFIEDKTRKLLLQNTKTVWLQVSYSTTLARIHQGKSRPLSYCLDKNFFDCRSAIYNQALIHVACDQLTPREIVYIIIRHLENVLDDLCQRSLDIYDL